MEIFMIFKRVVTLFWHLYSAIYVPNPPGPFLKALGGHVAPPPLNPPLYTSIIFVRVRTVAP